MKIVLKEDIDKVGRKFDVTDVKDGYAKYLISSGKAVCATCGAVNDALNNKKQMENKIKVEREKAQKIAEEMKSMVLVVKVETNDEGCMYSKVGPNVILGELKNKIKYDKFRVLVEKPIEKLGKYKARVTVYEDIEVEIEVEVVKA